MDPWILGISSLLFVTIFSGIRFFYISWADSRFPQRQAAKKRLMYILAGSELGKDKLDLYKKNVLMEMSTLDRLAFSMPRLATLDRMIVRAGLTLSASTFISISVLLAGLGFLAGTIFLHKASTGLGIGIVCLGLPYLFLKFKEQEFFDKFEGQFPEALDLLARGLRVGHALSSGIEMVSEEMDEPIKSEFSAVAADINLGLSVKEAFESLCVRIPITDLRFFAIAVLIQRETGGSLAQILDNLSKMVRERLMFKRKVKALTADGRISAIILISLPIVMFGYLYFVNYDYVSLLWKEKVGLTMIAGAIALQVIGAFVMKKIVSVEA